jgi:hypothetical protein
LLTNGQSPAKKFAKRSTIGGMRYFKKGMYDASIA